MTAISTAPLANSPASGLAYRPDIDGLRALAVLGVVAFHAGLPGVSGGFVGVDVFFVISGFLITGLLSREYEGSGRIDFGAFFVRRIRRLLPALALMTTATLSVAAFTMFPLELHRLGKAAQAVGLLVANVHFKNFSGGYFDPSTDVMPLLHTWSLAVEEQYYLAWPPLFWLAHRVWKGHGASLHRTTIVTLVLLALLSFLACVWQSSHERGAAFYLTPYRAWEFALGALLSYATEHLRSCSARVGDGLTLVGLAAVLGAMAWLDEGQTFPGAVVLIPVLGSVAVIAGGTVAAAPLPRRLLGNRLLVGIGLFSYSLYLWHWPVLALGRDYALGSRGLPRDLGLVALAAVLAWLSYRYVEDPIRRRRPGPFASRHGSYWAAAGLSLLLVAFANGIMDWSKDANAELNARNARTLEGMPKVSLNCEQNPASPSLAPLADCLLGVNSAPLRLAVWGDSHADQLRTMLDGFSRQAGIATLSRTAVNCPPLADAVPFKRNEGRYACGRFNDLVLAEIIAARSKGLRGVVLAGRWNAYLAQPVTEPGATYAYALAEHWQALERQNEDRLQVGQPPLDSVGSARVLQQSLGRTLQALSDAGLRVLLLAPGPELYFSGPQCLYRRSAAACTVPRAKVEARRVLALAALRAAARDLPNVRLVDPIDAFCDLNTCYSQRDGLLLYQDDNHISPAMSQRLGGRYVAELRWLAGFD